MNIPVMGALLGPTQHTASGGTAFITAVIEPWPGRAGPPLIQSVNPSRNVGDMFTHITKICYTTGGTAHLLTLLRPLNYTYFTSTFPKNTTVLDGYIKDDPGVYSTNYKYNGGTAPAQVADAAISSTNKYVCYQLTDGTWQTDTIASGTFGSSLTLTTGTPNRTTGTIAAGSPLYYFGTVTLKDPATGQLNPQTTIAASQTRDVVTADTVGGLGLWQAVHPGDPMILYSANGTNAGTLEFMTGFYARF